LRSGVSKMLSELLVTRRLYEMKVAWALISICDNERRFVRYLPHEQAEVISFFEYLDYEPTSADVKRAQELLGEAA
jgi:hypothetical protein